MTLDPPTAAVPPSVHARDRLVAFCAILVTAAALTLPAALGPVRLNDSFWIDWVWLDQFARELGNGTLYPRWLPMSHHGLGSPVFYYYPPLAFHLGSLFVLGGMGTYAAIIATFFAAYVLSGVGMYLWLEPQSRNPLLGALIYLVAPYHTFNFYARGALAEAVATALLPFVMVGIWRIASGKRGGFPLVAVGYAALVMSHLPLALLASLFLIGPYVLLQARRNSEGAAVIGAALAAGLALAAIYLVPAFMLEPYRDSAKLWENPVLHPSNWTFWNPEFRTSRNYVAVLVIAAALAIPLAGLAVRHRSGWAILGLVCVALAIGTVPAIWALPLLRSVQFPFRLLPVAEFALATGMATAAIRPGDRLIACLALLAITVPVAGSSYSPAISQAALPAHPDVPENLPPGERPYSWPSRWAQLVASTHREPQVAGGVTTEPVFYFPAWRVVCAGRAVPTFPAAGTQLLAYRGQGCVRQLGRTLPEQLGAAISFAALLGLLLYGAATLAPANRKRRAGAAGGAAKVRHSLGISR